MVHGHEARIWGTLPHMAFDRYGVLKIKGKEPETFWIVFFDSTMSKGNPLMQTSDDLDEKSVRDWFEKHDLSAKVDAMLAAARANPK
jgi:hypothetical protein